MAKSTATGISFDISDITKADEAIRKLQENAEKRLKAINNSFLDLTKKGGGVANLIDSLNTVSTKLTEISSKNISLNIGINNNDVATMATNLNAVAVKTAAAANEANKLINSYRSLSAEQKTSAKNTVNIGLTHSLSEALQKEKLEYKAATNEMLKSANKLAEAEERERKKSRQRSLDRVEDINRVRQAKEKSNISTARYIQQAQREKNAIQQVSFEEKNFTRAMTMNESSMEARIKKIARLNTVIQQLKNAEGDHSKQIRLATEQMQLLKNENKKVSEELKKYKKEIEESKKKTSSFARSIRQFAATLVSIQTLYKYFTTLVDVRGEFEKQHKSLQVLIGDLDMANEIWDKTVALAVKSPFSVKDLVTYTKQLAAYRVEADKLYETNKMLADISAGLGVDMNRLILAYGQVKAANYLRGTELRQFSEAGINILGELSKYFTELEGRAVSVGDVFERVSKRMVSFADVDAVLRRVTDEGGIFYQMQEKQAQTLIGMRMNLKDTVDLMLNDIGITHEKSLKKTLKFVKELVEAWRGLLPIITATGVSFATYFSVKAITKIITSIKSLTASIASVAGVVGLVAGAVVGLIMYLKQANEVQAAMAQVEKNVTQSLGESLALYKQLTDTVKDATKSHKEQDKALQDLKRRFEDILPDEYLELTYIKNKPNAYKEATDAMLAYYDAKARKQKEDKINQLYEKELTDTDIPELATGYKESIQELAGSKLTYSQATLLNERVTGIITNVVEDVKNDVVEIENIKEEIDKRLLKFIGLQDSDIEFVGFSLKHNISDLRSTLKERDKALAAISGMPYETYGQEVAGDIMNKEKENIAQLEQIFKGIINSYSNYAKLSTDTQTKLDEGTRKLLNSLPENLSSYKNYMAGVFEEIKKSAAKGVYEFGAEMQGLEQMFYMGGWGENTTITDNSLSKIAFGNAAENFKKFGYLLEGSYSSDIQAMVDNFQETIDKSGKKLDYSNFQTAVTDGIRNIVTESKVAIDDFVDYIPKFGESLSDVRTEVEGDLKNMRDQIKAYKNSIAQGQDTENALTMTEEEYNRLVKIEPVLQRIFEFLGGDPEKEKKRKNNLMDERIKVIDDMHKKYEELRKRFDEGVSIEGAFKAYKDAFADAYSMPSVKTMTAEEFVKRVLNFPNESAIVKYLNDVVLELAEDTDDILKVQLAKGKYEYDIQLNTKIKSDEALIREFEGLFSNYEVSLELDNLNIPKDLQKQLFNIDNISLPNLRQQLTDNANKFIGTDMEEEYLDLLDKLSKAEDKQLEERAKKYSKYLIQAQGERVKIKMEELRAIEELETLKLTEPQKKLATQAIQKESQQKLDKLEWEDFKDSGMYVQLFEDMELTSTRALRNMRDRLMELKGELKDLDADDLRNLYNQIEKLDKELASRNPFKTLTSGVKDYFQAVRDQKRYESELETQDSLIARSEESELKLEESLYKKKREFEKAQNDPKISKDERRNLQQQITGVETMLATQRSTSAELRKQRQITQENLDKSKNSQELIKAAAMEAGGYLSEAGNALPQIAGSLENVFGSMDAKTKDMVDTTAGILNASGNLVQGLASGNYLQAAVAAFQLIGEIAQIGDKKKERQIQKEIELVEKLGKQYEKLEKAINEAYSVETLKESYDLADQNIDDQIASYEEMMRLEEDKKKTDKKRIEEWKEEIEALREQQEELLHSQVEELGGTYDYKSATREFVDAWKSAFEESADGLKGLEESFDDFFKNIAIEQAVMGGASKILEPFLTEVNKSLENDFVLDDKEMAIIDQLGEEAKEKLNAFLKQWYGSWGDYMGNEGQDSLSGLSRGLQSMTESTAQIIEAYLNSVRFYVADSNTKLTQLVNQIVGGENTPNPMLSELMTQTEMIRAIRDMFSSVIKQGHSTYGGAFLKVSL